MILLANISGFISPNNVEYDFKDATARGWKGTANGVAELDSTGKIPNAQIPANVLLSSSVATTAETQEIISAYSANNS